MGAKVSGLKANAALTEGRALWHIDLTDAERATLAPLQLLTLKPILYAANVTDAELTEIVDKTAASIRQVLKAEGLGVAFHAKPAVAAEVPARIDHGDLTALLYLQGYRRAEFAG